MSAFYGIIFTEKEYQKRGDTDMAEKPEAIKYDKNNYRIHNAENKQLIKKSLEECGAGRSILIDNENEIIAGNGVYEQAKKLGIPVKVVETDGTELIAVKRTDLQTGDEKRTKLAILDNSTADSSEMDYALLQKDFELVDLMSMGIDAVNLNIQENAGDTEDIFDNLPDEIAGENLNPDELEEIKGDDSTATERVVITFMPDQKADVEQLLGMQINKIVYDAKEIFAENGIE